MPCGRLPPRPYRDTWAELMQKRQCDKQRDYESASRCLANTLNKLGGSIPDANPYSVAVETRCPSSKSEIEEQPPTGVVVKVRAHLK